MVNSASHSTSTSNPPIPYSHVASTMERSDVQQLASKASLLDIFTMAALTSHQCSTYCQTRRRVDAFSLSIRTGAWKLDDASLDDEDVLSLSSFEPSTPRLGSTSPQMARSSFGYHSIDTIERSIMTARNPERPREEASVTIIEPDEADHPTLDMDIDEGYEGGADDDSWMTWSPIAGAIAGVKPHTGSQVSRLLQFRTATDTAHHCSSLVYKSPRMRKRKPGAVIQQGTVPPPEPNAPLELKRIRQV
jgi:hypothetical protein